MEPESPEHATPSGSDISSAKVSDRLFRGILAKDDVPSLSNKHNEDNISDMVLGKIVEKLNERESKVEVRQDGVGEDHQNLYTYLQECLQQHSPEQKRNCTYLKKSEQGEKQSFQLCEVDDQWHFLGKDDKVYPLELPYDLSQKAHRLQNKKIRFMSPVQTKHYLESAFESIDDPPEWIYWNVNSTEVKPIGIAPQNVKKMSASGVLMKGAGDLLLGHIAGHLPKDMPLNDIVDKNGSLGNIERISPNGKSLTFALNDGRTLRVEPNPRHAKKMHQAVLSSLEGEEKTVQLPEVAHAGIVEQIRLLRKLDSLQPKEERKQRGRWSPRGVIARMSAAFEPPLSSVMVEHDILHPNEHRIVPHTVEKNKRKASQNVFYIPKDETTVLFEFVDKQHTENYKRANAPGAATRDHYYGVLTHQDHDSGKITGYYINSLKPEEYALQAHAAIRKFAGCLERKAVSESHDVELLQVEVPQQGTGRLNAAGVALADKDCAPHQMSAMAAVSDIIHEGAEQGKAQGVNAFDPAKMFEASDRYFKKEYTRANLRATQQRNVGEQREETAPSVRARSVQGRAVSPTGSRKSLDIGGR